MTDEPASALEQAEETFENAVEASRIAVVTSAVMPLKAEVMAAIDQWHLDSFRTGPIAQTTETMNAAYQATQKLKARLAALF